MCIPIIFSDPASEIIFTKPLFSFRTKALAFLFNLHHLAAELRRKRCRRITGGPTSDDHYVSLLHSPPPTLILQHFAHKFETISDG